MKVTKVSVTYGVKRSRSYQSADVSMTSEVVLEDAETLEDAFKAIMPRLVNLVDTEAEAALVDAIRRDSLG